MCLCATKVSNPITVPPPTKNTLPSMSLPRPKFPLTLWIQHGRRVLHCTSAGSISIAGTSWQSSVQNISGGSPRALSIGPRGLSQVVGPFTPLSNTTQPVRRKQKKKKERNIPGTFTTTPPVRQTRTGTQLTVRRLYPAIYIPPSYSRCV
jgi:hypothetical protein